MKSYEAQKIPNYGRKASLGKPKNQVTGKITDTPVYPKKGSSSKQNTNPGISNNLGSTKTSNSK